MKTKHILSAFLMAMLVLVMPFIVTSCDEDDQLDTNQFTGGVSLLSYGPCPVARGGELRFIGNELNQVTSITIPGCADVTEINRKSNTEISIIVPKTAQPGLVVLHTAKGDITSLTRLTFTEPIGFAESGSLTPNPVKAGQTLTIKGSYLNLVSSVIFAEDVEVSELEHSSADEPMDQWIKVVVPAEAQTGKIYLGFYSGTDTIMNKVLSDDELKVVAPAVAQIANLTGKKPGDKIEIAGTDLDLVTKVTVAGEEVEFAVKDGKLSFVLPTNTPDAAEIAMYPASGVKVTIAVIGMTLPTEVVATPNAELREGDAITISGKDLDVVEKILFPGVADAVDFSTADNAITVNCPAGFTSGNLILVCKSGIEVPVAIETQKPVFAAYNPSPVSAGNDLTITGENLDLVKTITFAGDLSVSEFVEQSASKIVVTVPSTAVTGALTITMTNGEKVEFVEASIDSPVFCFVPELPTGEEVKAGSVLTLNVVNGDKLTGVQVDGEDCQFIITEDVLMIRIPESAGLSSVIKLISSNGSIEYNFAFIPNTQQKRVVWSGMTEITWSDGGRVFIPGSAFDGVPEGAVMTFCYSQKDQTWAQAQVNNGWWQNGDMSTFLTPEGTSISNPIVPTDIYGWFSDGVLNRETSIVLTAELLEHLRSHVGDDGSAIIIQGSDLIFTQVYISWEISLENSINGDCVKQDDQSVTWSFPSQMTWDDNGRFRILRNGPSDLQNFKFKAGKTVMRFYKSGTGQIQVNNPNWSSITTVADWNGDTNPLELVVTQEIIDCFTGVTTDGWSNTALILQGDGLTIEKITIE